MKSVKTPTIKDDIKSDFNKALGTVTKLLLDVYLIELLKDPNENSEKLRELLLKTDDYYINRFDLIFDERIIKSLANANVEDDFIITLLNKIKENELIDTKIDLTNILHAMELFVKDEFKDCLLIEHNPIDSYISLISKNLDFIFDYAQDMSCALDLISNCDLENKDRMLNITFFSYARTTATHVESAAKEFIRSLYKVCHLHILKELIRIKNPNQTINKTFKKELNGASKKGMGSVAILLEEFFNFPTSVPEKLPEKIKKSFIIFKTFVEKRNKITHEDLTAIDDFTYIVNNCGACNDFLADILNEYVTAESSEFLIEEIMTLSKKIAQHKSKIIDRLYLEAKNHMPI